MAFDSREVALRSPASVPVHDDGDVGGKLIEVDLARQRFVGRSWRNPGQQLLKRHYFTARARPALDALAPRHSRISVPLLVTSLSLVANLDCTTSAR